MMSALYIYKTPEHKELMIRRCGVDPNSPTWGSDNDKISSITFMNRDDAIMDAEWGESSRSPHEWIKFSDEQYSGCDVNLILSFYSVRSDQPKRAKNKRKKERKIDRKLSRYKDLQKKHGLIHNSLRKAKGEIAALKSEIDDLRTTAQERKQTIDALSAEKGRLVRKLGRS